MFGESQSAASGKSAAVFLGLAGISLQPCLVCLIGVGDNEAHMFPLNLNRFKFVGKAES